MIFDTHAHYDDEAFDGDREELLESAALCDENLLERYLAGEKPDDGDLAGKAAGAQRFSRCHHSTSQSV